MEQEVFMAEIIHLGAYRLARRTGWSQALAHGYLRGNAYRVAQLEPPADAMNGDDDYALGVQLGYRYGLHYLRWVENVAGR
jgi:hypothetical protein